MEHKNLSTISSLERRYSFNASMANPIAESTTCGSSRHNNSSFHWGGTPISPKNRSNSNLNLSSSRLLNASTISPRAKTKIDPRVYADVQSKGLASRIVKYHENGSRLNRSMSTSNLYSKPGQFPVVHLQKQEMPYRATQQKLSMTRIAPPSKTMFSGNTLSSLLRSNSIVGTQKSDDELSHENRPIIHPPPSEGDLAPTRSVLDVLKEISRKRINSEDLDANDSTKKYCNRDNTDGPPNNWSYDVPTAGKRRLAYPSVSGSQLNGTAAHYSPTSHHSPPEQVAKKRMCNHNNDIASSLSSSLCYSTKRKLYGKTSSSLANQNLNSSGEDSSNNNSQDDLRHKTKIQRQQAELSQHTRVQPHFENISKAISCNTPITPLPETPLSVKHLEVTVPAQRTLSEPIIGSAAPAQAPKPKLTLFNKDYGNSTERVLPVNEELDVNESGDVAGIQFVKPKKSSSIINTRNPVIERTQKSKLALMLSGLRGELYQAEEELMEKPKDFVDAPKKLPEKEDVHESPVISLHSNTTTTTATSTKSSIIGIQSSMNKQKEESSKAKETTIATSLSNNVNNLLASTNSTVPVKTTAAVATVTDTKTSSTVTTTSSAGLTFSAAPTTTAAFAFNTPSKQSSPLVGLKLSPPTTASNVSVSVPTFSFGTSNNSLTTSSASVPVLGGFSFGTTNTTTTPKTNTSEPAKPSLNFGTATSASSSAAPPTFGVLANTSTAKTASVPTNAFTFGSINSTASNSLNPTTTTTSSTPGFGFNPSVPATASNMFANVSDTSNSKPGGFSFNTNTNQTKTSATVAPFSFGTPNKSETTTAAGGMGGNLSFGSITTNVSANISITAPTNMFAAKPSTEETKPAFSFGGAATQPLPAFGSNNSGQINAFNFGSTNTATSNQSTTNAFNFGAKTTTNPPVSNSSTTTNLFQTAANTTSFGAANTSATNSFGSLANQSNTAVAFGAVGANNTNTNNTTNTFGGLNAPSSNVPSFGGLSSSNTAAPFAFGTTAKADNKAGGFSFANNTQNNTTTNNTNVFGSAQLSNEAPKPAFSFGGNTTQTDNSKPMFAAGNAGNATSNNSTTSFGGMSASNNAFAFGSNTNTTTAAAPTNTSAGNIFGNAMNKSTTAAFSFGSTSNNSQASATNSTFNFGGSTSNTANPVTAAAPFPFGGNAPSVGNNQPFSFGSSATAAAPAPNIFGTAAANAAAAAAAAAATATSLPVNAGNPSAASNIFALSPAGGDRPYRRATRRLQK